MLQVFFSPSLLQHLKRLKEVKDTSSSFLYLYSIGHNKHTFRFSNTKYKNNDLYLMYFDRRCHSKCNDIFKINFISEYSYLL